MKKQNRKTKTRNENIFQTLNTSDWFRLKCAEIRKEYEKDHNNLFIEEEINKLTKYIPSYWKSNIKKFILTGELTAPTLDGAQIIFNKNWQTGESELYIRLFKKSTQDDVMRIWKEVEKLQKWMNEIWSPEISETDIKILELWQEVENWEKKPRNIAKQVSGMLAREDNSPNLAESTIRNIVADMKKQLNIAKKSSSK